MSERERVKVSWSEQGYLQTEFGQALYICELHRGCAYVPFFDPANPNWGSEELNRWIGQWIPLIAELYTVDDNDLQNDLNYPLGPRPEGGIQATWRTYQVYTFSGAVDDGEVRGYWRLATPELPRGTEERKQAGCPDGSTEPSYPRGP